MKKIMITLITAMALSLIISSCGTKYDDNVVLLPVENDPTVSIKIWFKVGSQNDPQGKEGLANLTAAMISDGATKNNSYEQILEKLFPLAAGYGCNTSVEMTVYSGRTHIDNMEEYYPLFVDGFLNPAFEETDFNRLKDEALNYLKTNLKYSSDEELGKAVLYNDIFEGTPYGHITTGTITGLESITLDDVKNFYNEYYTSNNYVLGVGGGYDEKLVDDLIADLNKLPDTNPQRISKPDYREIDGYEVTIVEKNAPATAISIGFPINLLRGTKDFYALAIANSWLGEHRNSSSHLYQVIREARGLNYGDYSYIENFPQGGRRQMPPTNVARKQQIFEIWIRPVPNETKHFALESCNTRIAITS
ncbi:MAG: pitrilysin family protein [Melioribacteraceae bacterium]|nr:pitrilysin family protein [Melioribacteraceae bacterium]